MSKNFRPNASLIKLGEKTESDSGVPKKVQLLRTGVFEYYEGEKLEITKEMLSNMKKNFDEKVRGVDLAIDYSHESWGEAAGWIKELDLSEDGEELWASVEWTKDCEQKLLGKNYRYMSAEFDLDYKDNESLNKHGPTLLGAGLTNRPFVKEMAPVVLNESKREEKSIMDKDKIIEDLKTELEAKKTALSELETKIEAMTKETKLAEKKGKFDKMLSEGKVVEAQREAFMSDDLVKFAELTKSVNLSEQGSGKEPVKVAATNAADAQDEILKLARELSKEKKITLAEAISRTLKANPELNKLYHGGN